MSRHSIFRRATLAILVLIGLSAAATSRAYQDISAELSRAQSLYFSAQFQESIALLRSLETRLANDAQRANELLQVKLYLGLGHLGLNQTDQAKARFAEVSLMDPKFTLDPKEYSPKVIDLFNEARAGTVQARCTQVCTRIDSFISQGNVAGARDLINSAGTECSCATTKASGMTRAIFDRGKQLYDQGRFADAAKEFAAVLAIDDKHELAREYANLSQQQVQLLIRQFFAEWRTAFDARQYDKATIAYERIRAVPHPDSVQSVSQIDAESALVLADLLTAWRAACARGDRPRLGLPATRNTVAQMQQCAARVCLKGDPALALARIRTRVNPQIDPSLQRYMTRRIVVNIEIDELGNTKVNEIVNAHERVAAVLREAVQRWKFNPAVIDNQPRCIETQIPISLIAPEV
jgi:tetratricopeptide (TPR) repeat protein